jgi:hypothetical protein
MLGTFTVGTFAPRIGETFQLRLDASTVLETRLAEAQELGAGSHGARPGSRTPFSLVFRGPARPVLPQQIYRMEHEEIGNFDLFLVPIGPDAEGMRYEAVFS